MILLIFADCATLRAVAHLSETKKKYMQPTAKDMENIRIRQDDLGEVPLLSALVKRTPFLSLSLSLSLSLYPHLKECACALCVRVCVCVCMCICVFEHG